MKKLPESDLVGFAAVLRNYLKSAYVWSVMARSRFVVTGTDSETILPGYDSDIKHLSTSIYDKFH